MNKQEAFKFTIEKWTDISEMMEKAFEKMTAPCAMCDYMNRSGNTACGMISPECATCPLFSKLCGEIGESLYHIVASGMTKTLQKTQSLVLKMMKLAEQEKKSNSN
jgi:hypothetical protein